MSSSATLDSLGSGSTSTIVVEGPPKVTEHPAFQTQADLAGDMAIDSSEAPDLALLLIGKTGEGKSETGNTILGESLFVTSDLTTSVTQRVEQYTRVIMGRRTTVVDTPGCMDTEMGDEVLKEIAEAILKHPEGFDAFLIIVKYPTRWTEETNNAIIQLERLFGASFYDHSIILVTHGDVFETKQKKAVPPKTFKDYMDNIQLGTVPNALHSRALLFNNMADEKEEMVRNLLERVQEVRDRTGGPYNNVIFEHARLFRQTVGFSMEMKIEKIVDVMKKAMGTTIKTVEKMASASAQVATASAHKMREAAFQMRGFLGTTERDDTI